MKHRSLIDTFIMAVAAQLITATICVNLERGPLRTALALATCVMFALMIVVIVHGLTRVVKGGPE